MGKFVLRSFEFDYRTNSKAALAKDLVEGIEKDLEKLKRQ